MNMALTFPEAYKLMMGFENLLSGDGIDPVHKELIKIRASQINGCAFCLDMHTHDARALGETEQRIHVLSAWRETTLFTAEERAVLALTEAMTLIHKGVSDELYDHALALFGAERLARIMMAIVAINAWNRIGVTTRLQPPRR